MDQKKFNRFLKHQDFFLKKKNEWGRFFNQSLNDFFKLKKYNQFYINANWEISEITESYIDFKGYVGHCGSCTEEVTISVPTLFFFDRAKFTGNIDND